MRFGNSLVHGMNVYESVYIKTPLIHLKPKLKNTELYKLVCW